MRRQAYPSFITTHAPPWGVGYSCGAWVPAVAPPWGLGRPGLAGNHPRPLQCALRVMHTKGRTGCAKPLKTSATGLCGAVAASHAINRPIWGPIPRPHHFFTPPWSFLFHTNFLCNCLAFSAELSLGYAFIVFDFEWELNPSPPLIQICATPIKFVVQHSHCRIWHVVVKWPITINTFFPVPVRLHEVRCSC